MNWYIVWVCMYLYALVQTTNEINNKKIRLIF